MADALDLESSGKPCKFESYYPHHKTAGLLLAVFIFIYDLYTKTAFNNKNKYKFIKKFKHHSKN